VHEGEGLKGGKGKKRKGLKILSKALLLPT
jgi:hypothetical protein